MDVAEALRRVAAELGDAAFEEHAPREVDGVAIPASLRPADGAELSVALAALSREGIPALVRGSGSALGLGNPPRGACVFLCTERLAGIDELDAGEGVCHAAAGTPLAELRARAEAAGWQVPLDPPEAGASLGGAIATARIGPRSLGLGAPRDAVLGLEVTLAGGERTRCGGRVVKNVTGYDLNKLYTGSLGSLGVIEGAWLRLRPLPEATRTFELRPGDLEALCGAGLAAARRSTARAVVGLAPGPGAPRLVVELAGGAAAVGRDAEWLAAEYAAVEAAGDALDAARARQAAPAADAGLRFRVSARASRLAHAAATLARAGASLVVQPGLGLLHAGFSVPPMPEEVARCFGAAERAAAAADGAVVLEAAPAAAKRGRDVFGGDPALLPLMRALKQRFDPAGILNPGRFAGFA